MESKEDAQFIMDQYYPYPQVGYNKGENEEERDEIFKNRREFIDEFSICKNKGITNKIIEAQVGKFQDGFRIEVYEGDGKYIFLLSEDTCCIRNRLNVKRLVENEYFREYKKMWGGVKSFVKTIRIPEK